MKMNLRRRVLAALLIRLFLNAVWIALEASTNSSEYWSSRLRKVFRVLDSPAFAFSNWLAPGHEPGPLLGVAMLGIVFSFVFYAALLWVIISVPSWWTTFWSRFR
jgi:hypothetical protein